MPEEKQWEQFLIPYKARNRTFRVAIFAEDRAHADEVFEALKQSSIEDTTEFDYD